MHGGNPSSSSADNSNRMSSLDKMIFLIALLVEKSRGEDNLIHLSKQDWNSLVGTAGAKCNLVFLHNVTKDNINICQTSNLIFSLTRNNPGLAEMIANMLFQVRTFFSRSELFFLSAK